MTSLKMFYQRGASAALLLELIVGAPDIAQAFTQIRGGGVGFESVPTYIPPRAPYIPPHSGTPALAPRPPGLPLPVKLPHYTPRTSSGTSATRVKPAPGPDAGTGPATKGIGDGGAGIDLTHGGDGGDIGGEFFRKAY